MSACVRQAAVMRYKMILMLLSSRGATSDGACQVRGGRSCPRLAAGLPGRSLVVLRVTTLSSSILIRPPPNFFQHGLSLDGLCLFFVYTDFAFHDTVVEVS